MFHHRISDNYYTASVQLCMQLLQMLSRVAPAPTQMNGFLLIIITTAETWPPSFPLYEKKHDRGVDTQGEEGACCTVSLSTVLVQCTLPLHAVSSGVVPAPSSPLKHGVLLHFSQQTHLHPVQVETFPTMILNKNRKDRTTTLHPLALGSTATSLPSLLYPGYN